MDWCALLNGASLQPVKSWVISPVKPGSLTTAVIAVVAEKMA
jgi:hypothetical protein